MRKRILSILLCVSMLMTLLLTGCNNNKFTDNTTTTTDATKTTDSNEKENKTYEDKHSIDNSNNDKFNINTDYAFEDDVYSLHNVTELIDFVETENGDPTDNTVISETSLNMALSLLLEGSQDNSKSYDALIKYLNSSNYPDTLLGIRDRNNALISRYMFNENTSTLNIANSAWFNNGVNPTYNYQNIISSYYNGRIQSLDFLDVESTKTINNWCSDTTNGSIPSIITPEVLAQNDGVLINAVYFLNDWETAFNEEDCKKTTFTNIDGSTSTINMMYETSDAAYYESNWCEAFMKPYANSSFVFVGVLPKTDIGFAVSELDLDDMLSNPVYGCELTIGIPQFKIEDENHLFNALNANGLESAFRTRNEDYVNCLCDVPVSVTDVIQKTYVDINPKGTEASASTAITFAKNTAIETDHKTHSIILDRPFVFMIYDTETHECLFIGKINTL